MLGKLSDSDRAILEFATHAPRAIGAREEAIVTELQMRPIRYYQRLNILVDSPAANEEYPLLMARLRRQRNKRELERQTARAYEES